MILQSRLYENSNDFIYNVSGTNENLTFHYPCQNKQTCTPYVVTLSAGGYFFESWGAKGGDTDYEACQPIKVGAAGGYSSGVIKLKTRQTFYIFIGAAGLDFTETKVDSSYVYNGGGYANSMSPSGGGSTDIRTEFTGTIDEIISLRSRIMVTGGGGGSECNSIGGVGGGTTGGNSYGSGKGGSQTSGGNGGDGKAKGGFWYGGSSSTLNAGGGGGGYYGGGYGNERNYGGGGGSSFVSGYSGCRAMKRDGTIQSDSYHYSGLYFINPVILNGNATIPNSGNKGYGAFRIVSLDSKLTCPFEYGCSASRITNNLIRLL